MASLYCKHCINLLETIAEWLHFTSNFYRCTQVIVVFVLPQRSLGLVHILYKMLVANFIQESVVAEPSYLGGGQDLQIPNNFHFEVFFKTFH